MKAQRKHPIEPEVKYSRQRPSQAIARVGRAALTIALALLITFGAQFGVSVSVQSSATAPISQHTLEQSALDGIGVTSGTPLSANLSTPPIAQCTLRILQGSVDILETGSVDWEPGTDGMCLVEGTGVRTVNDSCAQLTFFEGSTLTLEPNTIIEIRQIEGAEKQATSILLRQWIGRTWSRVVKMLEPGSRYEIQTPSAVAVVRGTQFLIAVDEAGNTTEHTSQGLVSVIAQEKEVLIPPGETTTVDLGTTPSDPVKASEPVQYSSQLLSEDKSPQSLVSAIAQEKEVLVPSGETTTVDLVTTPSDISQTQTEDKTNNGQTQTEDKTNNGQTQTEDKTNNGQTQTEDKTNNGQGNSDNSQGNGGGNDNSGGGQGNGGGNDNSGGGQDNGGGNDNSGGGQGNGGGNDNSGGGQDNGGGNDNAGGGQGNGGGNDNAGGGQDNGGGNDNAGGGQGNGGGNDNAGGGQDNGGGNDNSGGGQDNGGGNDNAGGGQDNGGGNDNAGGGQDNGKN